MAASAGPGARRPRARAADPRTGSPRPARPARASCSAVLADARAAAWREATPALLHGAEAPALRRRRAAMPPRSPTWRGPGCATPACATPSPRPSLVSVRPRGRRVLGRVSRTGPYTVVGAHRVHARDRPRPVRRARRPRARPTPGGGSATCGPRREREGPASAVPGQATSQRTAESRSGWANWYPLSRRTSPDDALACRGSRRRTRRATTRSAMAGAGRTAGRCSARPRAARSRAGAPGSGADEVDRAGDLRVVEQVQDRADLVGQRDPGPELPPRAQRTRRARTGPARSSGFIAPPSGPARCRCAANATDAPASTAGCAAASQASTTSVRNVGARRAGLGELLVPTVAVVPDGRTRHEPHGVVGRRDRGRHGRASRRRGRRGSSCLYAGDHRRSPTPAPARLTTPVDAVEHGRVEVRGSRGPTAPRRPPAARGGPAGRPRRRARGAR